MARSYRPVIRDQEFLLPPNMADWLDEDHLVWFLLEVVAQLDTAAFHVRSRRGGVGRQGYDPDMLLALLIYAYAVGERSSRRIERLCVTDVAFRVVCGSDAPDHTTIARFRADHQDAFKDVFAQVLRVCSAAGMVKVGVVSIDGTKIAANASRGANRTDEWVRTEAQRIAAEVVAQAAATDAVEDHAAAQRGGGSDDDLPPGFTSRSGRAANIKKALDELNAHDAQRAVERAAVREVDAAAAEEYLRRLEAGEPLRAPPAGADPVRMLKARIARHEADLADLEGISGRYAASKRSVLKSRLKKYQARLVAAQAAAEAGLLDTRGGQERLADRRAAARKSEHLVNTTDPDSRLMVDGSGGGSVQGYNAQIAVSDDHFILGIHASQDPADYDCYTPTLDAATVQADALGKKIDLVLADAGYFTQTNLTAPGPDRLIAPGKNHTIYAGVDPDAEPPGQDLEPGEAMRKKLTHAANAATYKRRSATVEPVFAHIKDQIGLRRFARRGLQAINSELHLAAAAVNLNRLHSKAALTA